MRLVRVCVKSEEIENNTLEIVSARLHILKNVQTCAVVHWESCKPSMVTPSLEASSGFA